FALTTAGALAVTDRVQAGGALVLRADALTLSAPLLAPSVALHALGGDVTQTEGGIETATLRATATGEVRLEASGNAIAAVSGRAGPLFRVASTVALAADDILAAEIGLASGGALTQPGEGLGIATDLLHAQAKGRVDLAAATNAIRALGTLAAPGGLVLRTATPLEFTLPATLPSADVTTGGDLTQLAAAPLSAGTLRIAAGGAVALEASGNAIARLLGAEAAGSLRLNSGGGLVLDGVLRATDVAALTAAGDMTQVAGFIEAPVLVARSLFGGVALDRPNLVGAAGGGAMATWRLRHDGAEPLRLSGLVNAPEVALVLAGGLQQGSGALRTSALALQAGGEVVLDGPDHRVAALSGRAGA
ncbi:hypothetical protein, partial [Falsiroseomonas oryzae]|uniref:hypothetical protein n=1 Tax=Falsiroseomonas oryzae TaxID=2766473 RepID=UPI0022EB593E